MTIGGGSNLGSLKRPPYLTATKAGCHFRNENRFGTTSVSPTWIEYTIGIDNDQPPRTASASREQVDMCCWRFHPTPASHRARAASAVSGLTPVQNLFDKLERISRKPLAFQMGPKS